MISVQARSEGSFVTESPHMQDKPLLFVDIDGVISLWGFDSNARPAGAFHNVAGVAHFLSADTGIHLLARPTPRTAVSLLHAQSRRANGHCKLATELTAWPAALTRAA